MNGKKASYDVMLLTVSEPDHADRLLDRFRDGVVLPAVGARDPLLRKLVDVGALTVLIGHRAKAAEVAWVVRRDVAVSGFDDRSLATHTTPALTRVRMPLREIGAEAARLLFALIDGEEPRQRHIIRPTEIVWRESTRFA